jgi:hypothetical protein
VTTRGAGAAIRGWRRALRWLWHPTDEQLHTLARSMAYMSPGYVPFELAIDVRMLTDAQLVEAWHDSQRELRTCAGGDLLGAVEERGRYLDELERRQPGLLGAWLASEASGELSEDPLSCARARSGASRIDWDRLTGGQASDR